MHVDGASDGENTPSAMEIFYDTLQKKCPMLLYIISNFLMTKSFLHKNIPSFIRNKRLFTLCSSKTISEVEEEINANKLAHSKVQSNQDMTTNGSNIIGDMRSSSQNDRRRVDHINMLGEVSSDSEDDRNEAVVVMPTYGYPSSLLSNNDETNPFLSKAQQSMAVAGRMQKPKSLWERWPLELNHLFAKVTYLIGVIFNMKANGGAKAAASNLTLLLRAVDADQAHQI